MKFLLVVLLFTGACIFGYRNKELVEKAAGHVYQDLTGGASTVDLSQGPQRPITPPLEPEVALAENEYYVRDNVRAQSGDYVVRLTKGTSVRKIGEGHGRSVVECAKGRVIVETTHLTRDPVVIATLLRQDAPVINFAAAATQRRALALRIQSLSVKIEKLHAEITAADRKRQTKWKNTPNNELLEGDNIFLNNEISRLQHEKDDLTLKMDAIPAPLAQDGH